MKVLFQVRPDFLKNPAGDSIQILATAQGLKELGVEVNISSDPNIYMEGYDLIHIFNLTRIKETYMYFMNAKKQKKAIAISPIYWNPASFLQREDAKPQVLATWNLHQSMRARLVRDCNLLLPNSHSEITGLKCDFPSVAPCTVIPNGFPKSYKNPVPHLIRERFPNLPQEFVLCVARISPRKNQQWLARTCQELSLPLVLIGPINDRHYFELIRSYPNVIYLGTFQGELLASAYASAKVHALPSWFETPGLSSLEAGACGTIVLTTDQGGTKEYFLDLAVYCNPFDEQSLHQALEKALKLNPGPLTEHLHIHYPWDKAAEATFKAYQKLV